MFYFSVGLVLLTISWKYGFNGVALIITGLAFAYYIRKEKIQFGFKSLDKTDKVLIFYGVLNLASVFWSVAPEISMRGILLKLPFVFCPVMFAMVKRPDKFQQRLVFFGLVIGVLIIDLICMFKSVYHYYIYSDLDIFLYHNLSEQGGLNAIYLSLINGLVLISLVYTKEDIPLWFRSLMAILIGVILLLLQSRMIIIGLILIFMGAIIWQIRVKKAKVFSILVSFFIVAAIGFSFLKSSDRLSELEDLQINQVLHETDLSNLKVNGISIRLFQYRMFYELMSEEPLRIFTGYGLKAQQVKLNEKYQKYNLYTGNEEEKGLTGLSFHNQYIYTWLSCGVFGFIVLFMIIWDLISAKSRSKNQLILILSTQLFALSFLSEMILERHRGAIFFLFLLLYLKKTYSNLENRTSRNPRNT